MTLAHPKSNDSFALSNRVIRCFVSTRPRHAFIKAHGPTSRFVVRVKPYVSALWNRSSLTPQDQTILELLTLPLDVEILDGSVTNLNFDLRLLAFLNN